MYYDTSVLAAYYCPEPLSNKAEQLLLSDSNPCISELTKVEFFSAISKKVRLKELKKTDAEKIVFRFIMHIDSGSFMTEVIKSNHFRLAGEWISGFKIPLRTLDALNLAVAFSMGECIVTSDFQLASAANVLSINSLLLTQ